MDLKKIKNPITNLKELLGPRYARTGDCSRCGKCCENEDCEHFSYDDEGLALCAIHPSVTGEPDQRPEACPLFPQAPPIIIDTCGYRFIDKWENDKSLGVKEI